MEVSLLNEASTSTSSPLEILSIEEDALSLWVSDDEDGMAIANLLTRLIETWNRRLNTTFRKGVLAYVKKAMAIHGVPFTEITRRNQVNIRTDFNFKYLPTCSIRDFFHEISDIEGRIRRLLQTSQQLYLVYDRMIENYRTKNNLNSPLVRLTDLARKLDYRSVAYHLGYLYSYRTREQMSKDHNILISLKYRENMTLEYPIFVMMVLQVLISVKTNPRANLRTYLKRLAENASVVIGDSPRIPLVAVLVEVLNTSLVLGFDDVATDVALLEKRFSRRRRNKEDLSPLQNAKTLIFYSEFLKGKMTTGAKERFADELMVAHEGSIEPTLYLPALSLRVQADIETRDEERFNLVIDLMSAQPELLPPLVDLLNNTKLDDNIPDAVEMACTKNEKVIHESSDVWLIYCKDRVEKPEKFGVIQDVLLKCMSKLFHFLDYASNRDNGTAWLQLWNLVQKVSPESVKQLWEERRTWWPKFHAKPLSDLGCNKYKTEVLTALSLELNTLLD